MGCSCCASSAISFYVSEYLKSYVCSITLTIFPGNGNWSIESFEVETSFWYCSIYKSQYFHRQGVNASSFLSLKFLLKCPHSIIAVSNMDFFDFRLVGERYKISNIYIFKYFSILHQQIVNMKVILSWFYMT